VKAFITLRNSANCDLATLEVQVANADALESAIAETLSEELSQLNWILQVGDSIRITEEAP
jgi:hypothetical protein